MKNEINKMVELCKVHKASSTKLIVSFLLSMRYNEINSDMSWFDFELLDLNNKKCLKFLICEKIDGNKISNFISDDDFKILEKLYKEK